MNERLKNFFFASKLATSMMNLMTVIIFSLVVAVFSVDMFQQAYMHLTSVIWLLILIAVVCIFVIVYCIGTIVYAIFVYTKAI